MKRMKVFSFDGPYARAMGRVFDLVLLHILWIVCSIPIVTIGASTTALFTVTLKMTKNQESYIVRSYFDAFKSNFIKATKLWMIAAISFIWILGSLYICMQGNTMLLKIAGIANAAILLMIFLAGLYVFPIQARYENCIIGILKNSVICSLRFLPYSIGMAAVIIIPVLLTGFIEPIFPIMIAVWIFGGSSLIAYAQSCLLTMVFQKIG